MTPAAGVAEPVPCEALLGAMRALGIAGVELAPDPIDPDRLRHRPAVLPPEQHLALARHKPAVLALLRGEGVPSGDSEAVYVFEERLGIAEGLGMPTHPGSPAWLVAIAETLELSIADR